MATQPKAKKCTLKPRPPLPHLLGAGHVFRGAFDGFSVTVTEVEDMKRLITMGYFGKATLSRTYPQFNQRRPEILRERVFEQRQRTLAVGQGGGEKVVVVPDSDSDGEDYFTDLRPHYEVDRGGIRELCHLGLEEAFFLAAALQCLEISHDGARVEVAQLWDMFQQSDRFFPPNYVAYYHFRAKQWVVKTGIKFGGDFLLYKQGPPFYHASFLVLVHVVDENLHKVSQFRRRSMKYVDLMGLNRLCETAGKELLICELKWPQNGQVSYHNLTNVSVREIVMKRWQDKEAITTPSTSTV